MTDMVFVEKGIVEIEIGWFIKSAITQEDRLARTRFPQTKEDEESYHLPMWLERFYNAVIICTGRFSSISQSLFHPSSHLTGLLRYDVSDGIFVPVASLRLPDAEEVAIHKNVVPSWIFDPDVKRAVVDQDKGAELGNYE
jgi:hypothetical protein